MPACRLQNESRIAWVIDLFEAKPSRANFLTAVAFSKRVWDQSEQRKKERSCVCKQNELKKNHYHFTHRSYRDEHNKSTSRKKKIFTPNAFKKFYMQARNILTNLSQARLDPKIPAWLTTLHHVKSYILRVLLYLHNDTKIYLRLNQNAQRWIGKKVPSFYFNNNRMSNKTRCDVTYL